MMHFKTRGRSAQLAAGLTTALAALILLLATSGVAEASSTYPSQHWAYAQCYRTSVTNTWTVMSGVYMNRADGYERAVYATTTGDGGYFTGGSWTLDPVHSHTSQWLYYQVVVLTPDSRYASGYSRTDGTWLRAHDALGDGTSGLDSEVWDKDRGMWIKTGYTGAGSAWDASYANGILTGGIALYGSGQKYVYAHYIWGPIWNLNGDLAFRQYEVYEPLGWMSCY